MSCLTSSIASAAMAPVPSLLPSLFEWRITGLNWVCAASASPELHSDFPLQLSKMVTHTHPKPSPSVPSRKPPFPFPTPSPSHPKTCTIILKKKGSILFPSWEKPVAVIFCVVLRCRGRLVFLGAPWQQILQKWNIDFRRALSSWHLFPKLSSWYNWFFFLWGSRCGGFFSPS